MLFGFYVFNRHDELLFWHDFYREAPLVEEGEKHILGLTKMLGSILSQLAVGGEGEGLKAVTTSHYKMHVLVTPTGYRFILTSDRSLSTVDGQNLLREIWAGPFVTHCAKNPHFVNRPQIELKQAQPLPHHATEADDLGGEGAAASWEGIVQRNPKMVGGGMHDTTFLDALKTLLTRVNLLPAVV